MEIKCEHDELVPLSEIRPHPKNPNKHSPEQLKRLGELLQYQGQRRPLIVSSLSGFLEAGHGTLEAMKLIGATHAAIDRQSFENEEQEYAFMVSDNAIAEWADLDLASINAVVPDLGPDFNIDLLGIKDFVIEPADKFNGDEDAIPATSTNCEIKLGDLFILGTHRLLCGDSTRQEDVARLMNGEKADMVFTSPPYADLRDYSGNLVLDPKHLAKLFDFPAKTYVVNLGLIIRNREIVQYWNDYLDAAKERSLKLLNWGIWDKGHASAPAHQQAMFGLSHEWVFVFGEYRELNLTKPNKIAGTLVSQHGTQREKDGSLRIREKRPLIRDFRQLDSVVSLPAVNSRAEEYTGHPASFPVALPEEFIKAMTDNDDLVTEPFLGSGSTLIACEKTNRRCFGMEIDPLYCQVIIDRWEKFTGKKAVKIT